MTEKGHCKHGEFELIIGCPKCMAEQRAFGKSKTEGTPTPDAATERYFTPHEYKEDEPIIISRAELVGTALVKIEPEKDVQVQQFYTEALKALEYAEARVITIVDDLKPATEDLSLISKLKKAMEDKRKEYVKPLQDHVKDVNDAFKTLMEPIETADRITREKILAFQLRLKLIREEQERINALRLEAAQKEMELTGELSESVGLVEVIPEVKRTSTELGTIGMRDNWTYEVISFVDLPDEYKVADTTMLNAIAKKHHDQKQIPGVKFINKPILAVNAR